MLNVWNFTDANIGDLNPFRYRSCYYDTETGLYYLNSRYYDPETGRFINADSTKYLGAGGNFTGYNLFAYCGNNPVLNVDDTGAAYRAVGAGVQFEISVGNAVGGIEIIVYWDKTVCNNRGPVVAIYTYGGVSIDTDNALVGSILGVMTENDAFLSGGAQNATMVAAALTELISSNLSVSASGVLIMGNEAFRSTTSYEKSFTSIGGGWGHFKGSVAYSDSSIAISLGGRIGAPGILPSWGISKTYYEQVVVFSLSTTSSKPSASIESRTLGFYARRAYLMKCVGV